MFNNGIRMTVQQRTQMLEVRELADKYANSMKVVNDDADLKTFMREGTSVDDASKVWMAVMPSGDGVGFNVSRFEDVDGKHADGWQEEVDTIEEVEAELIEGLNLYNANYSYFRYIRANK